MFISLAFVTSILSSVNTTTLNFQQLCLSQIMLIGIFRCACIFRLSTGVLTLAGQWWGLGEALFKNRKVSLCSFCWVQLWEQVVRRGGEWSIYIVIICHLTSYSGSSCLSGCAFGCTSGGVSTMKGGLSTSTTCGQRKGMARLCSESMSTANRDFTPELTLIIDRW